MKKIISSVIPAKAGIQSLKKLLDSSISPVVRGWNDRGLIFLLVLLMFSSTPVFSQDFGNILGSAIGGVGALANAAKEITPSEEHYIGRTVAAMVLSKYPLLNDAALNKYVNDVGLVVAAHSDRPNTYGGYHFAVLNSNEPNAFACPGGIILVNKGLLKQAKNEDQLAAVLAHEVGHVAGRHGINAIKKARWTQFAFYAAGEVGKNYSGGEVAELTNAFQGVVTDVAKKVIDSGYSKADESKADSKGMEYLYASGYNPGEMVTFLKDEEASGIGHTKGPFSSHPKAEMRIKALEGKMRSNGAAKTEGVRTARFKASVN